MRTIGAVLVAGLLLAGCSAKVYRIGQGEALVLEESNQVISVGSSGELRRIYK